MTSPVTTKSATSTQTIFAQAATVFPGWTDAETGQRVLRLRTLGEGGTVWSTLYHQYRCFLQGGRQVLLHASRPDGERRRNQSVVLDLTTGAESQPFPAAWQASEVCDETNLATIHRRDGEGNRVAIWDLTAQRELAAFAAADWSGPSANFLSDGRRVIAQTFRRREGPFGAWGPLEKHKHYEAPVFSRHHLLTPGEEPKLIFEAEGYFCNHVVACPTDPDLYTYDRWPTPARPVDQVISFHSVDGRRYGPVPLDANAMRPADMWGVRDHYVWTPDGQRIVSYLCSHTIDAASPTFNHNTLDWWLSALDVRTGEDLAARYPAGRWGGHMQITPDSRYILSAGGPGYDKLYAVSIEGLREGWNEHILCNYPAITSTGTNADPFAYPFPLPDQSGVIFTAGWPGPAHGIYLVEWPAALK
jgi:hypothetical protein